MAFYRVLAFVLTISFLLAAAQAEAAQATRPESSESYIAIDPMNMTVMRKGRSRAFLQVEIGLDIPDKELRDQALNVYPRLQDAYVQSLRYYTTYELRLYYLPDLDKLTALLQSATDRSLGAPGANVLLSQVLLTKPY